jgi:hypothetical protein
MVQREKLWALLVVLVALAGEGCNGFGTNCSTNSDCQAQNPEAVCDPTLKVCFVYSGPVVTAIQPVNQAVNVPPDNARVVATFSTSVVDAGPGTFLVVGQGFDTYGTYSLNAASTQATFTPLDGGGLALGTDYTVSLTAGIADTSGNPLLPFTSTFSTMDGTFGSGGTLRPGLDVGAYALGGNYYGGFVTAVDLYIGDGTTNDYGLQVGVSAPGGNPQITTFLQNVLGQEVNYPSAAIAPDGTALVAWTTQPTDAGVPVTYTSLAASYNPNSHAWSSPVTLVGPDPSPQVPLVVAFNATNGDDGLAVWLADAGASQVVHGRYYNGASGWLPEGSIQSDTAPSASNVSVSADFSGNVLTAWQSQSSGPAQIVSVYLGINGDIPPAVDLSQPSAISVSPQAALGVSGFGAVVWAVLSPETDGGVAAHVFAATFDPDRNPLFTSAVQLDTAANFANFPQVGVAANGNALAIWQELGAIVTSTYTKATNSWSAPFVLDSSPTQLLNGPAIAVDPGGNAVANWIEFTLDAGYQMFGGRYTVDGGWRGQEQLTVGIDPVEDIEPSMVIDAQGRTMTLERRSTAQTHYLEYIPFH